MSTEYEIVHQGDPAVHICRMPGRADIDRLRLTPGAVARCLGCGQHHRMGATHQWTPCDASGLPVPRPSTRSVTVPRS